jgi:predicted AAA+ superfamily ATPase
MKRTIDYFLLEWKNKANRKPLLLRGARQVGKTHAARTLGASFKQCIEINFESHEQARAIIEKDMDAARIILQLSELLQKRIEPGNTLLFFDEIQQTPKALLTLRYLYEYMPDLHIIAAGSLLDFAIEEVGIPVGRISSLYMYPLSFVEFLVALGHKEWARTITTYTPTSSMSDPLHEKLLNLVGVYIALGGMPEAINIWIKTSRSRSVQMVHADLIYTYQQDFGKYAKKHQIKYLNLLFLKAIEQLSNKFMYTRVGEYKKRELYPALELLEKAGLVYPVVKSAGQGIPIGAQADMNDFKLIFLDVGLSQALLKLDISSWFIDPLQNFINKGEIVEAFAGQEILAYSDPIAKEQLFYWYRDVRASEAEVDYLVQLQEVVVPIEVKAGANKRIKSMHIFLESHPQSKYGIRFWAGNYVQEPTLYSYPLYAIAKPFIDAHAHVRAALDHLINS